MAGYNSYYPVGYQPYYGPQIGQNQFVQQPVQQIPQRQNEFVRVRSKEEAMNYPVAPSNSVTFINEAAPYCYVKTMGASQLDRPVFEVYKLVKEDDEGKVVEDKEKGLKNEYSELKMSFANLQKEVEDLKASVKTLKEKKPVKKVILQEADDE